MLNLVNLKNDVEFKFKKPESSCRPIPFRTICREIDDISSRPIGQSEFKALISIKKNKDIIIGKTRKAHCSVVLDKNDYISEGKDILNQKQFERTDKSLVDEKKRNNSRATAYKY